ncbi:MAG: hypothetical protein AAB822_00940, partial [Patescibacteria group bacterium]
SPDISNKDFLNPSPHSLTESLIARAVLSRSSIAKCSLKYAFKIETDSPKKVFALDDIFLSNKLYTMEK